MSLPDDALVVRGGMNSAQSFERGSGVTFDAAGKMQGVSVNCAPDKTVEVLTSPDSASGYLGIPHTQVGVTTVGRIRAAGGEVLPLRRKKNLYHATLVGLTPEKASELFCPTIVNPSLAKS